MGRAARANQKRRERAREICHMPAGPVQEAEAKALTHQSNATMAILMCQALATGLDSLAQIPRRPETDSRPWLPKE